MSCILSDFELEFIDAFLNDAEISTWTKSNDPEALDQARVRRIEHALMVNGRRIIPEGPIAHLKGFSSGIQWRSNTRSHKIFEDNMTFYQKLLNLIDDHGIRTLVWDGDSYSEDSFTHLLPMIKAHRPKIQMMSFLQQHEHERFHHSWKGRLPGNTLVFLIDRYMTGNNAYDKFGILCLRATGAKHVYSIGGGKTTLNEFLGKGSDVNYFFFNLHRILDKKKTTSPLSGQAGVCQVSFQGST